MDIKNEIGRSDRVSVERYVRDSIGNSIWNSVWDSVLGSIWDSVEDSVQNSVHTQMLEYNYDC